MRPGLLTLLAVLASLSLGNCRDSHATAPSPPAWRLLTVARDVHESSSEEVAWAAAELCRIAALARQATVDASASDRDDALIAALNEVVFGTLGFVREVDDTSLEFVLLPSVLRTRRGNCVGLGTMYLALGEVLSLNMEGVLRPGHFFVRTRGAKTRNVELLRKGEDMPESWYVARFPVPAGSGGPYGRGLSLPEVRGVVEYDIGNERRRQGRIADARNAYEQSTLELPDFAEAHASLGTMQQLLGALDAAEKSYGAARRASPELPGLDGNIDLLKREREAGR
jgi:hypothetical protein